MSCLLFKDSKLRGLTEINLQSILDNTVYRSRFFSKSQGGWYSCTDPCRTEDLTLWEYCFHAVIGGLVRTRVRRVWLNDYKQDGKRIPDILRSSATFVLRQIKI